MTAARGAQRSQDACEEKGKHKKRVARMDLATLDVLAPRPGLEPGTYGLTESQAFKKPLQINCLRKFITYV